MKSIFLTIFIAVWVVLPNPAFDSSLTEDVYCNDRFHYCVQYPSEYFTTKAFPDNEDGIILSDPARNLELRIYGSHNVLDWSLEEVFQFTFGENGKEVTLLKKNIYDSYFECTYRYDGKVYYRKVQMFFDSYLTIVVESEPKDLEILKDISSRVTLEVNM